MEFCRQNRKQSEAEKREKLSKDLRLRYGKGFSRSNLNYMRQLYDKYETLSHKLSWSHYYELLKVEDDLAREFYEKQAIIEDCEFRGHLI